MARTARARLVRGAAAALLAGALAGACGSSPPTDKNFGTNLGADFRAPNIDAGNDAGDGDMNVTLEAGAGGAGGAGAAGTSGAAGAGGGAGDAGGVRDAGGAEAGG